MKSCPVSIELPAECQALEELRWQHNRIVKGMQMALSRKQAEKVATVMVTELGKKQALDLMNKMNEAAYGKNPAKSLKSFRRIISAIPSAIPKTE